MYSMSSQATPPTKTANAGTKADPRQSIGSATHLHVLTGSTFICFCSTFAWPRCGLFAHSGAERRIVKLMPWLVLFAGSWLCWASDKRGSWHADAAADAADRGEFGLRNIVLNNVPTCSPNVLDRRVKERWLHSSHINASICRMAICVTAGSESRPMYVQHFTHVQDVYSQQIRGTLVNTCSGLVAVLLDAGHFGRLRRL